MKNYPLNMENNVTNYQLIMESNMTFHLLNMDLFIMDNDFLYEMIQFLLFSSKDSVCYVIKFFYSF